MSHKSLKAILFFLLIGISFAKPTDVFAYTRTDNTYSSGTAYANAFNTDFWIHVDASFFDNEAEYIDSFSLDATNVTAKEMIGYIYDWDGVTLLGRTATSTHNGDGRLTFGDVLVDYDRPTGEGLKIKIDNLGYNMNWYQTAGCSEICISGSTDSGFNGRTPNIVVHLSETYTPPEPWDTQLLSYTTTGSSSIFYTTIHNLTFNYWSSLIVKEFPTDNNYYNINSSIHCGPQGGGTGGPDSNNETLFGTNVANSFINNGTVDCTTAGTYYQFLRDSSSSSTILYYAPIYFNGTSVLATTTQDTRTRIVSHDPANNQNVGSPTTTRPFEITVHVYEDDFIEDGIRVSFRYSHFINDYQETQTLDSLGLLIEESGTTTWNGILENLTATGSYNGYIELYSVNEPPWWNPFGASTVEQLDEAEFMFYVGVTTTPQDIENARIEAEARNAAIDESSLYDRIKNEIALALNEFLYAPPIGYGTYIYDIITATSTSATTTLAITHTIPPGMPGAGEIFTFDIGAAIANSVQTIRDEDVDTIEGDPFEKFMYYWNLLWYSVLAIWIVQQVFNMYQITLVKEKTYSKPTTYQKSGHVRKVASVRRDNNNYQSMRRSQFKSYD